MGRRVLSEDRKKLNIKTTINNDLMGLYEEFLEDKSITHKSKLIERKLKEVVEDENILNELVKNDILPKNNNLTKKR